tara:strand:+ start:261 stop:1148 length:888 start_codon:yes stop_codon:yes gene_type:complete
MANNKYAGFQPKNKETIEATAKLDKVNPYEFRKGMDYELIQLGCSRLAESTVEEREKATTTVMKNLEEHAAYYSALIQFEAGMDQGGKINESSFKTYLKTYTTENGRGDGMVEVDKEIKDDKMVELKEAISQEIKNILSEKKGDDDAKDEKKAAKGAKGKDKKLKALDKEADKLEKEKDKNKTKLQPDLKKYKDGKMSADDYRKKSKTLVDRNKEINARLDAIKKEKEDIALKEKLDKREVAKTMMEKDTHMAILEIIKEYGISLREGSQGVKAYYEIAKTAYQEGFMAGLHKIN